MALKHFGTILPSAAEYVSRYSHASIQVGDWIYIDGGELQYNGQGESGNPQWELLNYTLALDMSSTWTNDTVTFNSIPRGGTPLLNDASLWYDAQEDSFYNFGGWASFWVSWPSNEYNPPPSLWKFAPDNRGGGQWTQQQPSFNFPPRVPTRGLSASGNGVGYYLGGMLAFQTYPALNYGTQLPLTGMIEFNSSTGSWNNLTSTQVANFGDPTQAGQAAYGGAHFVPQFGPEGVAVFFGMIPPFDAPNLNTTSEGNMTLISVFEPLSQTWYTQTATGPNVPSWRGNFCTTGVAGDNGTYEIIMHGGSQFIDGGAALNSSLSSEWGPIQENELNMDQIYVLSLPSFAWFQLDYAPIASRSLHTCHTVGPGSGQLLVIGGQNFDTTYMPGQSGNPDVFTQGLGVFDLEHLEWMPSYNASGTTYKTPQAIKNYVAVNPTPAVWNNPGLAQVFATQRFTNATNSGTSPTHSPSKSSTPIAAIAGGVVGGVLGLLLIAGLVWFFLRRKRPIRYHTAGRDSGDHNQHLDYSSPANLKQDHEPYSSNIHEVNKYDETLKVPSHGFAQELPTEETGRTQTYELPDTEPVELYTPGNTTYRR